MGASTSKPGEQGIAPPRRTLKSRSSFNLLKRSRTPSNATRASCPLPASNPVNSVEQVRRASLPEERTLPKSPDDSLLSRTVERVKSGRHSVSSTSTSATATRLTTPTRPRRNVDTAASSPSQEGTYRSPSATLTPKILLPTTSILPEDSPTKYGIRSAKDASPDLMVGRAQRKDMTAAGLFAHSVAQLKAHHSLWRDVSSNQTLFSHSSPCLLSPRKQQRPHGDSVSSDESAPGHGHASSQSDLLPRCSPYYSVVHALPMKPSQLNCFHEHDEWHRLAKERYHVLHPVTCAVCDEYGAPSEGHEAAGDDFVRCSWCWLIICGKCHDTFEGGGVSAMMERERGGVEEGGNAALSEA